MESRVVHVRPTYSSSPEAARQLEREVEAEVALKERELNWLNSTGAELLTAASDDQTRTDVAGKIQSVQDAWNQLQQSKRNRNTKLSEIQQVRHLICV